MTPGYNYSSCVKPPRSKCNNYVVRTIWPLQWPTPISVHPPSPSVAVVKLSISRRTGRRGSIQQNTPSQCYKDLLKGSVLQSLGVEGQARMIQVVYIVLWTMKINRLSYFILEISFYIVYRLLYTSCVLIFIPPLVTLWGCIVRHCLKMIFE